MVNERAKQFSSFSPLRGYSDLLKAKEKIIVQKRELTEESMQELSKKLGQINRGMMIKVVYYCEGEYIEAEGMVSALDLCYKKLTLVKRRISFEDIYDLKIISYST
ncbi:MAG: YolD-like family protein [Ruminococcaceae bacterium]|nr:YolD-like family protein [Oscillospiraceae bacterium]